MAHKPYYISSFLYANVSHQFQALLGRLLTALNVLIYLFALSRRSGVLGRHHSH